MAGSSPTHHRAVALLVCVALALGLARWRPARDGAAPPSTSSPPAHPSAPRALTDASAPTRSSAPLGLDPNTADARALEALPGIGPALATRIRAAREAGTRFERAEDLLRVRGVGPHTLARIAPYLRFANTDAGVTGPRPSAAPPAP